MQIDEGTYKRLPAHLQALFERLPNPSSDEVLALFPQTGASSDRVRHNSQSKTSGPDNGASCYGKYNDQDTYGYTDSGSAARFFMACPFTGEDECESASIAEQSLSQPSERDDSVASDAPISERHAGQRLRKGSPVTAACMDGCNGCIPIPSRASTAGRQESTGITGTTPSPSKSCGCAPLATAGNIRSENGAVLGSISSDARRFTYCPKASKADRDEGLEDIPVRRRETRTESGAGAWEQKGPQPSRNSHPTVKPTALMRYLCRLVTPLGGIVLDPFMGSGSTGKAAVLEGFGFVGIEMEEQYLEIARLRIAKAQEQPSLFE